jgi:outer membrane protein OmpA-like peptidoglycan-associated protein
LIVREVNFVTMKILQTILFLFITLTGFSQHIIHPKGDSTLKDELYTNEQMSKMNFPEICPNTPYEHRIYNPAFYYTSEFYKERYKERDLMYKVTDNWGNGNEALYGTRNMRPILHGVAYRGGANNYYHAEAKRHNHNPLPNDGIENLCKEGFAHAIYLYRTNFESAPTCRNCESINQTENEFNYHQLDYFDDKHIYQALKLVYQSAIDSSIGPVYLHCWNGWHASGLLSALILRQFCGFSSLEASAYWDLGTDGANNSPRYNSIRDKINNFVPYPEFMLKNELGQRICPPMPEFIDSSQLHITIEHLVIVPEAIPTGTIMILENLVFAPGKTSIPNVSSNQDMIHLLNAMKKNPDLVIEISGHTDKSGNEVTNKQLSSDRAKFVHDYLIQNGINANRLSFKGYGSAKPAYSNSTKDGRDGNRRIEIKILSKKAESLDKLVDDDSSPVKKEKIPVCEITTKKVGEFFIMEDIIFEPGSITLTDSSKLAINELISILKSNTKMVIEVVGYTDISGIEEKNILFSAQRAQAVHDYILTKGIEPHRVSFSGCGPEKPIAPNAYRWGRDKNRRIEILVLQN